MTVADNPRIQPYTAAAAATEFDFSFKIYAAGDVDVYVDGVLKTLTTHYTVTFDSDAEEGTVTFVTPMTGGEAILIVGNMPRTQPSELSIEGGFPSETLANMADRSTILAQEAGEKSDRALKLKLTDESGVNPEFTDEPAALQIPRVNAAGTGIEWVDASDAALAGSYTMAIGNILVGDGTNFVEESGATARASLGVAIGSDVQAYAANLTTYAGKSPPSGAVVGTTDSQTLTNKTIDGSANTISNIDLETQVTGELPIDNIVNGSGASPSAYLRGDGTWAVPAGSGDTSGPGTSTENTIALWDSSNNVLKDGPAIGTAGQVLYSAGAGAPPAFGDLPTASDTTPGIIEIADDSETYGLALTTKAVTPRGIQILVASTGEMDAGTQNQRHVTPARFVYGMGVHGWRQIWDYTASGDATVDVEDVITSDYQLYQLWFWDLIAASNAQNLLLRLSVDNGTSYYAGASDYAYAARRQLEGSTGVADGSSGASAIHLSAGAGLGNAADECASGMISIYNPTSSSLGCRVKFETTLDYDNNFGTAFGSGKLKASTSAVTAARILMGSGNITSGYFALFAHKGV